MTSCPTSQGFYPTDKSRDSDCISRAIDVLSFILCLLWISSSGPGNSHDVFSPALQALWLFRRTKSPSVAYLREDSRVINLNITSTAAFPPASFIGPEFDLISRATSTFKVFTTMPRMKGTATSARGGKRCATSVNLTHHGTKLTITARACSIRLQ